MLPETPPLQFAHHVEDIASDIVQLVVLRVSGITMDRTEAAGISLIAVAEALAMLCCMITADPATAHSTAEIVGQHTVDATDRRSSAISADTDPHTPPH